MLLGAVRCCSVLFGAVRCCSALFDGDQKCQRGHKSRACPVFAWHCLASILYGICLGVHKAQEMLAAMFSSFDHPELSSTEQWRANVGILLGEMLYSFDLGLIDTPHCIFIYPSVPQIVSLFGCNRGYVMKIEI